MTSGSTGPIGTPDLDTLLASIEAQRAGPPGRAPSPRGPRRGFLDLCAVAMAVYALVVATPVGGLIERGYYLVVGKKARTRSLISYFDMERGGPSHESLAQIEELVAPPEPKAPITVTAEKAGLAPGVARAVVLMASGGKRTGEHFEVQLLPSAQASFAAVRVPWPASNAPAKVREEALIEAVAKLSKRLGGDEPAVAAAAVELAHVAYAVDRARASGHPSPASWEAFRDFLPSDHRREAEPLVRGTFALVTAFDMRWPVDGRAPISSPYGVRVHPVLGTEKMHTGTDLAVPTGTEVRASAGGVVLYATTDSVNGKFLKIDHGFGFTSAYCHASELLVKRGDQVSKGDVIMRSGATGRVSGPHLHFQLEIDGRTVNPELFRRRDHEVAVGRIGR